MADEPGQPPEKSAEPEYNKWRFLTEFFGGVFSLINSGKIYPLAALAVLGLVAFVAWQMPEADLGEAVLRLVSLLASSTALSWVLIVLTNVGWIYLLRRSRRTDQGEIDRLADLRKELMHGRELGHLTPIEQHRSSEGLVVEEYLLPFNPNEIDNASPDDTEEDS